MARRKRSRTGCFTSPPTNHRGRRAVSSSSTEAGPPNKLRNNTVKPAHRLLVLSIAENFGSTRERDATVGALRPVPANPPSLHGAGGSARHTLHGYRPRHPGRGQCHRRAWSERG